MFTVRSSPVSLRAPGASVGGRGQCQCVIRCHQATRQACERRLKGREVIQKIKLTLCKVNLKTTRTNEYCCILLGVLKNLMISCKTSYILYLPQPDAAWNTQFITFVLFPGIISYDSTATLACQAMPRGEDIWSWQI